MDMNVVWAMDAESGRSQNPQCQSILLGLLHDVDRFTDKIELLCHGLYFPDFSKYKFGMKLILLQTYLKGSVSFV
jgi:hypothetical protein